MPPKVNSPPASDDSLRRRELRLGRSLRGIVLSLLATPVAGTAACHADGGDPRVGDAALDAPFDALFDAQGVDASVPIKDAAPSFDATTCEAVFAPPLEDGSYEDAPDGCGDYRLLPCGLPRDASLQGCFVDLYTCAAACGDAQILYCDLVPLSCSDAGPVPGAPVIVNCTACNGITGRRPLGLRAARPQSGTPLGDYFASMAHLESASVRAFRDLERWLVHHDAPRRLTIAARRAAGDERRHARAASRLARRFGGRPQRPRVGRVPTPSLFELVVDDAVEGCVGETFGALLATWQAERAEDPRVRKTLGRIALDEVRHAALAWEILVWGASQLGEEDRRRVTQAMDDALSAVEQRAGAPVTETTRRQVGHPAPCDERELVRRLTRVVKGELETDTSLAS
jgi:hypothetical protein